jgi:xanthine phosphoribosyltransferase
MQRFFSYFARCFFAIVKGEELSKRQTLVLLIRKRRTMKILEERIQEDGIIIANEIVKVDSFINHQIDTALLNEICAYLTEGFTNIDKVLTIETSGIAFALGAAQHLGNIPVVFAKKSKSKIVDESNVYTADVKSFTRGIVSKITIDKRFLQKGMRVLIVDDFLAEGNASLGLVDICHQAGVTVVGVAVAIEKSFQGGHEKLVKMGIPVKSAADIIGLKDGKVIFKN